MNRIKGLYETHLHVESLERSIIFYEDVLGLELCHFEEERRIAFFWIGNKQDAILGLWEKPKEAIETGYFTFRCEKEFILNEAVSFLKSHNIQPCNFLKDGKDTPMVFAWMPALAIYFHDLDGNELEFISILNGKARPELGVIKYDTWLELTS